MKDYKKRILITGGAGFIGSHAVRHFVNKYPEYLIVNLDKLTYAGNLMNLRDVENKPNYRFVKGDITDYDTVKKVFDDYGIDTVIHFAAESHVDRSIENPDDFVKTNVLGTVNLLNAAKSSWKDYEGKTFYHISTDEVYGSLGDTGKFTEQTPYDPHSPYSASKAASDHFVRAYYHTYGLPVVISNASNNYGPYQFPEKLIPLIINNILEQKPLPVYGKGENVRDWLYVEDHVKGIDTVLHKGKKGETYNIGGENERKNIEVVEKLCEITDELTGRTPGESKKLIRFVKDRAGHDWRYALDISKIKNELGWRPETDFDEGLRKTVRWYLDNKEWLDNVTSGEYRHYYERMYKNRGV
ncbi:MAG: dTDP-glucose 4,6-dehydratase [Chlorobi bacterium]|nr:dTDP-glucose 4,6-dehydratase [Chlorobiota bacterium]